MPGLASLLRGRTTNPRAGARRKPWKKIHKPILQRAYPMGQNPYESPYDPANPPVRIGGPSGGKTGGVVGYQRGGRTFIPPNTFTGPTDQYGRAWGYNRRGKGKTFDPRAQGKAMEHAMSQYWGRPPPGGKTGGYVGGYQIGGPVGVSPEEVDMASDIYARAAPEQQAQITGGGGGPGMMEEEAAIGEALAMAMGGGGGGPPMNGAPPMGGPPMGGMI